MHNGHVLELRAEVGVISRPTIRVAGVDALDRANDFLFITMKACMKGSGCGLLMKLRGRAVTALSGVLIQDGGLVFMTMVLPIISVSSKHTTIESCVVNPNYGHGISASSGTYHGNVVYKSATGFLVGGAADVRYNAIFSVQDKGMNLDYTDEDAHFGVWSTSSLVLIGNAGACSTGPSFRCSSFNMRAENFLNNSGHCSNFGLTIKGGHTRPVQDITLWRIRAAALWGYVSSDLPTFNDVRLADFSVGLVWGGLGGDPVAHTVRMQTLSVTNSLFLGRSTTNPSCFEQAGILLPIAGSAGFSISPSTCGPLGGHWFMGIYGMDTRPEAIPPSPSRHAYAQPRLRNSTTIVVSRL
jgi:hypothetical protein